MNKFAVSRIFLLFFAIFANCSVENQPKLLFSLPSTGQNSPSNYGVNVSVTELALSEGGVSSSFTLSLSNAPSSDVTIQCSADAQLAYTNSPVTFTQSNYLTPQTITVNAIDDLVKQGNRTTTINFTVNSTDSNYNNVIVTPITVQIADNDTASITAFAITSPATTGVITGNSIAISVPFGTNVTALIPIITFNGTTVSPANGVAQDFTSPVVYTVTATDLTTVTYTVTVTVASASAKAITAFSFASPAATGTISGTNISVTVPFGTTVTGLVATFTTTGASVSVGATAQVSGTTANDFSSPLTYTVTATDSSTQNYIVTVTIALNPAKEITAFSFASPAVTGTIVGNTITVSVPNGTNVNALVPSITITGASISPASGVAQNFTSPVTYTVTAADGSTATYTVSVSDQTAKDLTSFSFPSIPAVGAFSAGNIAVTVPFGTPVTALVATFTTTGVSVKIGATTQVSGTTANNFTVAQTYIVTAADTTTQNYTVTVTVASNTTNSILDFSFVSPAVMGSISGTNIAITVPFGTNVTALVPTISINGASVSPASGIAQNFTSPLNYTVTAGNATTQLYTVTVTVAASASSAIVNGSFQSGTVISVGTNSTATLATPVNLSKAFVYCGAQIQASTASTMPTCQLSSPTTVAIKTGASSNTTANWFVVEYAFGVTVQRGSIAFAAGDLSKNITLTAIDQTKTFALVYSRTGDGTTSNDERRTVKGFLTSSTNLTIDRQESGTALTVEWQVVEMSGANVQSGLSTIAETSTNTSAPLVNNLVTGLPVELSKSFLFFSYNGGTGIAGVEQDLYTRGSILNSTTVSFNRVGSGIVGSNKSINIAWFVIEMMDGTSVQSGSTTITGTGTNSNKSITANFGTGVSTNKSMIIWSNDTQTGNAGASTQDSATYSGKFNSSTQLQFDRYNDEGNDATIDWSVVTFQ